MRDKLLMLSLGLSVFGLIALYITAQGYQPPSYTIAELSEDFYGKQVSVEGAVGGIKTSREGHIFFTLADQTGSIQVVAFKTSGLSAPARGSIVKVQGEYTKYNENPEIIAKKIETVSKA